MRDGTSVEIRMSSLKLIQYRRSERQVFQESANDTVQAEALSV